MYKLIVKHYAREDVTYYPTAARACAVARVILRRIGCPDTGAAGSFSARRPGWLVEVMKAKEYTLRGLDI